jgi:hypothetical protein
MTSAVGVGIFASANSCGKECYMSTTTTTPLPDVSPPHGFTADPWEDTTCREPNPWRLIHGPSRVVTDHEGAVRIRAVQYGDSRVEDVEIMVWPNDDGPNSDQARELASALLQAADAIDGWTAR